MTATHYRRPQARVTIERPLEIAIALTLLASLAPLLVLLMIAVRLDSPGGPLFTQPRVGRAGRVYTIFKLRTFYRHRFGLFPNEEIRWGDPRVTRIGHLLRRCKLDELPQLMNVVLGHMSLVGPRPDIPLQAQHYADSDRQRLAVRPGMTGIAQISGNTWLTWEDRIRLDRWYVENRSLRVDIAILLHTIPILLRGERRSDDPLGVRRILAIADSADKERSSEPLTE
jgi:lipopolysaccharide/colanic/teichoic acid biosynthesis glycosyltransferase